MYPLEDNGAQVLESTDFDNSSSISRASSALPAERSEDGIKYRYASQFCAIYARRVGEPWIEDVQIAGHILRCNVCKLTFLRMDDETTLQIFGAKTASALKCCSCTCYREWHSRTIRDRPSGIEYEETGRCPFQRPDTAAGVVIRPPV